MGDLVVGFDLDMTLVDSSPGIRATVHALSRETGVPIDADVVVSRLGPKLETELAHWFAPDLVTPAADRFRALYVDHGVPGTFAMPGARESLAAVSAAGGRSIVVTAKYEPNAIACLAHVGLRVEHVVGWRWGPAKGEALAEHGASVYVGDTPADVEGAGVAGAVAVAVPSGPHSERELEAAGADVLLRSLEEFPDWLRGWLSEPGS